jgi:hypothetical protein
MWLIIQIGSFKKGQLFFLQKCLILGIKIVEEYYFIFWSSSDLVD